MILWLQAGIPLAERHAYSIEFPKGLRQDDLVIPKNTPDGYVTLCRVIVPVLGKGIVGAEECEEYYAIPKCEICETLGPIEDRPER